MELNLISRVLLADFTMSSTKNVMQTRCSGLLDMINIADGTKAQYFNGISCNN